MKIDLRDNKNLEDEVYAILFKRFKNKISEFKWKVCKQFR